MGAGTEPLRSGSRTVAGRAKPPGPAEPPSLEMERAEPCAVAVLCCGGSPPRVAAHTGELGLTGRCRLKQRESGGASRSGRAGHQQSPATPRGHLQTPDPTACQRTQGS